MKHLINYSRMFVCSSALFVSLGILSQEVDHELSVLKRGESVYVISEIFENGYPAHVGVHAGEDGLLIVDGFLRDSAERLVETIREIDGNAIRYVINTHIHDDHTGANDLLREAGAIVIRARDDVQNFKDPLEAEADINFSGELILPFNGEKITVTRFASHSDGDAIVFFPDSNVLFMGDTYFSEWLPQSRDWPAIYRFASQIANEETLIVPGHGRLSNKKELEAYNKKLYEFKKIVVSLHDSNSSVQEIVEHPKVLSQINSISTRYGSVEGGTKVALENLLRRIVEGIINGKYL